MAPVHVLNAGHLGNFLDDPGLRVLRLEIPALSGTDLYHNKGTASSVPPSHS